MKAREDQRTRRRGRILHFTTIECGFAFIAILFLLRFLLIGAVQGAEDQTQPRNVRLVELFNQGKYQEAKPLAERLLSEAESDANRHDPNQASHLAKLAAALSDLGQLDENLGDYSKAEQLLRRALETRERLGGEEHVETIRAMIDLATLYSETGDPQEGEPLLLRAHKLCEKALGHDHELTALILNRMGILYDSLREYGKSELLYQQALDIRERLLGPENPATVRVMENLASLYQDTGEYPKAISLMRRVLAADESAREPDFLAIAGDMSDLASSYLYNTTDVQKALALLERALEIRVEEQGLEHRDTARSLDQLAQGYFSAEEFAKAAQFLQRALEIAEKRLGPYHRDTGVYMNNLALAYLAMGKQLDALKLARRSSEANTIYLKKILSFTSEKQRLAFVSEMRPLTQFGTLGSAPDVARTILRLKGIVLDSILEDRSIIESSSDSAQQESVEKLRGEKQRLMELTLRSPNNSSAEALRAQQAELRSLEDDTEEREKTLMRQITGLGKTRRALEVTVEQVQAALPPRTALVEYLTYDHILGRAAFGWGEWRYGAVVICRNRPPQWVPLGSHSLIDRKILVYRRAARGETDVESLKIALVGLYKHVWAEVQKALPTDIETLVISPDGELNFLSFATLLLPDDRFLAEKYSLRYVASGRDLLRKIEPSPELRMTIFADPNFIAQPEGRIRNSPKRKSEAQPGLVKRDLETLELPPLPGTFQESRALEAQATKAGWQPEVYLGKEATESELRKVQSPRILHLATHGFFLPMHTAEARENEGQRGIGGTRPSIGATLGPVAGSVKNAPKQVILENPMLRSGLALAGAQTTLRAWSRGEVPPTEDDGIINALEVGGLNLKSTWLVTLSACDTGVGEVAAGEGVMGLRRGFIEAGTQNLLMTLWSVADEQTAKLMVDFYEAARSTNNAPKALADVQREWMIRLRAERGLQAAVTIAGPFIMNSQGPVR